MRRLLVVTAIAAALLGTVRDAAAADYEVGSSGQGSYLIDGQADPTLTLTRGRSTKGVTNNGASPAAASVPAPTNRTRALLGSALGLLGLALSFLYGNRTLSS